MCGHPQIIKFNGKFVCTSPHGTLKSIKKNFRIIDALEWLKRLYFYLGDSLLIISALKLFLFCLCLLFSFLLPKKWGAMDPPVIRCCQPSHSLSDYDYISDDSKIFILRAKCVLSKKESKKYMICGLFVIHLKEILLWGK